MRRPAVYRHRIFDVSVRQYQQRLHARGGSNWRFPLFGTIVTTVGFQRAILIGTGLPPFAA